MARNTVMALRNHHGGIRPDGRRPLAVDADPDEKVGAMDEALTPKDAAARAGGAAASGMVSSVPPHPARAPMQGTLFDDPAAPPADGSVIGYRGPTACSAANITYRQLDYWARTGLVAPSIRSASGSGSQRLYSFKDILVLKVVKRLLDTGVSLQNIRTAVDHLRRRGVEDLAGITLISDGVTVYECHSSEEVVDLLRGGQGVFGIAVSGAWRELVGSLAHLPGERADSDEQDTTSAANDELARRRRQRSATA
jgi:DNA-binding transcriptional MerR regulator